MNTSISNNATGEAMTAIKRMLKNYISARPHPITLQSTIQNTLNKYKEIQEKIRNERERLKEINRKLIEKETKMRTGQISSNEDSYMKEDEELNGGWQVAVNGSTRSAMRSLLQQKPNKKRIAAEEEDVEEEMQSAARLLDPEAEDINSDTNDEQDKINKNLKKGKKSVHSALYKRRNGKQEELKKLRHLQESFQADLAKLRTPSSCSNLGNK